jgi:hypothetical protein
MKSPVPHFLPNFVSRAVYHSVTAYVVVVAGVIVVRAGNHYVIKSEHRPPASQQPDRANPVRINNEFNGIFG